MKVTNLVVALAVGVVGWHGALGDSAAAQVAPGNAIDPYRYVVSVGCAEPNGRTIVYVWHTGALPNAEGDRVFKVLVGTDFEECLSEIARTKSGLYERLANLGTKSGAEVIAATMQEVSNLWSQIGVYEAVREVAPTGKTGPSVQALMERCDELQHVREQGSGEHHQ